MHFVHSERSRMVELLCYRYCIPHLKLTAWEPVNRALLTVYYGSDTTVSYTLCHSRKYVSYLLRIGHRIRHAEKKKFEDNR